MKAIRSVMIFMLFVLACLSVILLKGCSPNHRYVKYKNMELISSYPDVAYRMIFIGTPGIPFDQNLELYGDVVIRLSSNHQVSLRDLTVEDIKRTESNTYRLDESISVWPKNTVKIESESGYMFYINQNRILSVNHGIYVSEHPIPDIIGLENEEELYSIPFSHDQMIKMFGKPEKITDTYHN